MAAKRFLDDSDSDPEKINEKKTKTLPSFASVIGEMVMMKNLQNLFATLEPLLRRVVNEEVESVLRCHSRSMNRSPSLRIQAASEPSSLALTFNKRLSLPIFTGSKIWDYDGNPLHILLVDKNGDQMIPTSLPHALKLETVVLDGDFPPGDRDTWTSDEFNNNMVKERAGKRPLLTGDLNLTLRDGIAPLGDIEFTDNSSWIRSRKFRVGVRVAPAGSYQGVRIREAMTEAFIVKDHRGELYKKHYPPMLNDEVWRLEKIGKDGAFHRKLASSNIKSVQDFLKLYVVDAPKLRKILGLGMSEKMWEVTIKHARTCEMDNKLYIFRGSHFSLVLNPICQVVRAEINGQVCPTRDFTNLSRCYIQNLVAEAYARWDSLEVTDGCMNDAPLLTQGEVVEQYPNNHQAPMVQYQAQNGYSLNGSIEFGYGQSHSQAGSSEWGSNPTFAGVSYANGAFPYGMSETLSEGDMKTSISFINGD